MKRLIPRISLCILFGCVTTIAVAWVIAYTTQFDNPATARAAARVSYHDAPTMPSPHYRTVLRLRHIGAEHVSVFRSQSVALGGQSSVQTPSELIPHWGAAYLGVDQKGNASSTDAVHAPDSGYMVSVISYGWPMRALWGGVSTPISYGQPGDPMARPPSESRIGFIETDLPIGLIPYQPILPAMLVNTLLYAGMWWCVLGAPGMVIKWRRRRAGRCVQCGYDLRASGGGMCPECGTQR